MVVNSYVDGCFFQDFRNIFQASILHQAILTPFLWCDRSISGKSTNMAAVCRLVPLRASQMWKFEVDRAFSHGQLTSIVGLGRLLPLATESYVDRRAQ